MSSIEDVIIAIEKFELELIDKEWSDEIWTSDFTQCPDYIPEEFTDKFSIVDNLVEVFADGEKIINDWLDRSLPKSTDDNSSISSETGEPNWTTLHDVDHKKLLSILYYYICDGLEHNQNFNSVYICVRAASFYFTLLMIPGSDACKIYQQPLLEKCMEVFFLYKHLKILSAKNSRNSTSARLDMDYNEEEGEENSNMNNTLTVSQQGKVVMFLNTLISSFEKLILKFSFKKYPEAINNSLSTMAEITRMEQSYSIQELSTINELSSIAPFIRKAFSTMKNFCSTFHGRIPEIIRLVLFYLMPNLTSCGGIEYPELSKMCPRQQTIIRNMTLSFICENLIPMGEDAHLGLKVLIHHLCYAMVETADNRAKLADIVMEILSRVTMDIYFDILKWIFRLCAMEAANLRGTGLELLSRLVYHNAGSVEMSNLSESQYVQMDSERHNSFSAIQTSRNDQTNISGSDHIYSFSEPINYVPLEFRRIMLGIIIDRIQDDAVLVKSRALSILSDLIIKRPKNCQVVQIIIGDIFLHPYAHLESINYENTEGENEFLTWQSFVSHLEKLSSTSTSKELLPGGRVIFKKLFEKCLEERVNVRKAALNVIANLFTCYPKWMTNESLALFGSHCRDPALSIRKEMLQCVSKLLSTFPDNEPLIELWVEEVAPIITDREIRVQESALQFYSSVIISNIVPYEHTTTETFKLPWRIIEKLSKKNKRPFLQSACSIWKERGTFNKSLINLLKTHVGTVNDHPLWFFLSCISDFYDIEDPDFILKYYLNVISKKKGHFNSSFYALITLRNSLHKVKCHKKELLCKEMCEFLNSFDLNPGFVGIITEMVAYLIINNTNNVKKGKEEFDRWGLEIITNCENHLKSCLRKLIAGKWDCGKCCNNMSLLGHLVGMMPQRIRKRTFWMLLKYLMFSASGGSYHLRQMKALAVITVSRMALAKDFCARNWVGGLATLLSKSLDPALLNNLVVAIADMGESYASLIEPLIPFASISLKSKFKTVKEVTLGVLTELLQEEYLKARGPIIFHLLSMVVDENLRAQSIVKYYFRHTLMARNPYKMYELLLPVLFHLNKYTNHPEYPKIQMTSREWEVFDLSGKHNHLRRLEIYKFMLNNIPNAYKMKCSHFICTVVLNGVADNIISLSTPNGEQLLLDSLSVLSTKEIKLEYNELAKEKNEEGGEEENAANNILHKLGKEIFTAVQKKEIIEIIVPICCKLKRKLVIGKRKFLPFLYKFVRELVKDYKEEITDIFKADPEFGAEILHEIDEMLDEECEVEEEEECEVEEEEVDEEPLAKQICKGL